MSIVTDAILITAVIGVFGIIFVFIVNPLMVSMGTTDMTLFDYVAQGAGFVIGNFVCWMTGIGCTG